MIYLAIRKISLTQNLLAKRPLNYQYFDLLKNKIEMGLVSTSSGGDEGSTGKEASSAGSSSKKNTIKDVQERIKTFLLNAKIFERGLKSFNGQWKTLGLFGTHLQILRLF